MKSFKQMSRGLIIVFLFLSCQLAFAVGSPITMLQNAANQMLSYLQQHQAELNGQPQLISGIVERVLVPQIDVNRMAGLVVGRQAWQAASPVQRQLFIAEFKKLVISTYANALASYDNDQVQFY